MNTAMIREMTEHDDFERLLQMMNDTAKRFNPDPIFFGFSMTAQELKEDYLESSDGRCFLVEDSGSVVAFMGVSLSPITKNGNLLYGFIEGYEGKLIDLVKKCSLVVRDNGGEKLLAFVPNTFGQIRNSEITLWEKQGFTSEGYANVAIMLNIEDWIEPDQFDKSNIGIVSHEEIDVIKQLLIEDGEHLTAQLLDNPSLKHVILTLRNEHSGEVTGVAHYRVSLANKGTGNEILYASGFSFHLRPRYNLSKLEKRRLLQAALLSAKQLGVDHVITRLTLKNFDVFALFIREGFDDPGIEKNSMVCLYKKV